jgi:hypothetical protein
MRILLYLATLWAMLFALPANAQYGTLQNPLTTQSPSVVQASFTSVNGALAATANTVTLTAASQNIVITTSAAAAIAYVNFNGTATTSNYAITPGTSFTYSGPAISSFSILGATAAGTYSVFAH